MTDQRTMREYALTLVLTADPDEQEADGIVSYNLRGTQSVPYNLRGTQSVPYNLRGTQSVPYNISSTEFGGRPRRARRPATTIGRWMICG